MGDNLETAYMSSYFVMLFFLWSDVWLHLVFCRSAGLHAVEGAKVSASGLSSFRAAVVRASWSEERSLCSTGDLLLQVDLASWVFWSPQAHNFLQTGVSVGFILGSRRSSLRLLIWLPIVCCFWPRAGTNAGEVICAEGVGFTV